MTSRRRRSPRAQVLTFEHGAAARGARSAHLETFSVRARHCHLRLGDEARHERRDVPRGIVKWHLLNRLEPGVGAGPGRADP